jgi:ankyrin repeat protein
MGWPSALTYQEIAATGLARSLRILIGYGDLAGATAMLDADPSLADDPGALAAAAEGGHESIVRLMLQHRPGVAARVAVVASRPEFTELLFQAGMNPNFAGWLGITPLHRFARQGDVAKAAVFLDHGANLHARDEEFCTTPLGYAAMSGKVAMVEFLLSRGAKPTLPDDLAWATPLALATFHGHEAVVRLLKARSTEHRT